MARRRIGRTKRTATTVAGGLGLIALVVAVLLCETIAWILLVVGCIGGILGLGFGFFASPELDAGTRILTSFLFWAAAAVGAGMAFVLSRKLKVTFWSTMPFFALPPIW